MLFLGFSAGLPLLLVLGTLSFWLREAGIDRSMIGYLSWIGLDWLTALMVLAYLRQNAFIDSGAAARLLQRPLAQARETLDQLALPRTGMLERRGHTPAATFHLAKGIAKDLLGKAAYTKTRGLNPIRYAEMIKAYLQDHGSITPMECRELLGLGESQSAKVEISRYLKAWTAGSNAFLVAEGHGNSRRYFLGKKNE